MTQQLRSRRFEARLDPATDDLISEAARQTNQSRSAFIIGAARAAAQQVVSPGRSVSAHEALATILGELDSSELASCPLLKGLRD